MLPLRANGPGSDGNEGVLRISQSSSITKASTFRLFSVIFIKLVVDRNLPLCRDVAGVFYIPSRQGQIYMVGKRRIHNFQRILPLCKTQTASSRFWTIDTDFTSNTRLPLSLSLYIYIYIYIRVSSCVCEREEEWGWLFLWYINPFRLFNHTHTHTHTHTHKYLHSSFIYIYIFPSLPSPLSSLPFCLFSLLYFLFFSLSSRFKLFFFFLIRYISWWFHLSYIITLHNHFFFFNTNADLLIKRFDLYFIKHLSVI